MSRKDETTKYEDLLTDIPAADIDYALEDILAEYGKSREDMLTAEPEAEEKTCPLPIIGRKEAEEKSRPAPAEKQREEVDEGTFFPEGTIPAPPRPISVEEVVGRTVASLMEEKEALVEEKSRRTLFSRRKISETEQLYAQPEPEEDEEAEPPEPELPLYEAAEQYRRLRDRRRAVLPAAFLLTMLMAALVVVDQNGLVIPYWTGELLHQSLAMALGTLVVCLLGRDVIRRAVRRILRKQVTPDLMAVLACAVTMADCGARLWMPERCAAMPFSPVACCAMCFAMLGAQQEASALYDCYRTAAMNEVPPYRVTDIREGACKQKGTAEGFYRLAESDSLCQRSLTMLLPVILTASVVFAGLASFGQRRGADFLWCWSAILAAASGFALPLAYTLPFGMLARRLHNAGAAVAGYAGMERVCRRRAMILTDSDLFPPGTVTLNGMKIFGEELDKVVSYSASLARASGSGLVRLFDGLLQSEGGHVEKLSDFSFYEEGGVSATVHGETVLLGTASFMRKVDVRLPTSIKLRTGVYLAIDRQLAAVFAVKYLPSENVSWALHLMQRGHILPILAVRDGNITPALLKRKFSSWIKAVYPDLSTRLALSEQGSGTGEPAALLFREGLLPYAETVVGGRRCVKAARRSTLLAVIGSVAGTLLSFYLTFAAAYTLLTPAALLVFLLLWTVPVFLLAGGVKYA